VNSGIMRARIRARPSQVEELHARPKRVARISKTALIAEITLDAKLDRAKTSSQRSGAPLRGAHLFVCPAKPGKPVST